MQERLQKIISQAGVASRRHAETMITDGRVAVNGTVITELGAKADLDQDIVTLDGQPVLAVERKRHILLYKPAGYLTSLKDPQGRPLVTDLVKGLGERLFPVGRLDYNTEGILLLTNDGDWANRLAHPRYEIDKEYHVRVQGNVSPEQLGRLAAGVDLEDGRTAPAIASLLKESDQNTWISLVIHEGKYRQVRRMCEKVGLSVVRLRRNRYGFLDLKGLKPGEYRELTADEAKRLADGLPALPPVKRVQPDSKPEHRTTGKGPKKPGTTAGKATEIRKPESRHIRRKI